MPKTLVAARQWWSMPLILVLRRQKKVDICELDAYRASSKTARGTPKNPVVEKHSMGNRMKMLQLHFCLR